MGGKGSGRKRKPTEFHILHGSFKINPSRQNEHEPEAPKDKPTCPPHLPPIAKTEWKFICGKLEVMKLLTSADRPTIELYCQTYAQWREATKQLNAAGPIETTVSQSGVFNGVSPWFKVQQQAASLMTRLLVQMGFSPSARAGLFVDRQQQQASGVARRQRG